MVWLAGTGNDAEETSKIFEDNIISPFSNSTKIIIFSAPIKEISFEEGLPVLGWFDEKDPNEKLLTKKVDPEVLQK